MRYRFIMKRSSFWYQDFWPSDLDLWPSFRKTLTWTNYIFWNKCARALIFEMYMLYHVFMNILSIGNKTFVLVTLILTFDLVLKTLTWTYNIYWTLRYKCIIKRSFFWYQNFWPSDLDFLPSFKKTLIWTISIEPNQCRIQEFHKRRAL
jgi:hypothetical protein